VIVAIEIALFRVGLAEMKERPVRPRPRRWRGLLVLAAFFALAVALPDRLRHLAQALGGHGTPPSAGKQALQQGQSHLAHSRGLGIAATVALGVLLVAAVAGAAYLGLGPRRSRDEAGPDAALLAEVDAGIADLEDIEDPRAAVLACYERMQRAVAACGLGPQPSDTPRQLVRRVLEQRAVAAPSAERLAALFERARFSPYAIDEDMRAEALAALHDVRSQLLEREELPA
jgi:hypothetical protein